MVTASEWEEREQRAGHRSGLLFGHWSICSELVEMYRKYCFTENFKTLCGIKAESLTSLMALGAGKR